MSFTEADYQAAATKLGVPIAAVKAVAEVEASGQTTWSVLYLDGPKQKPPIRLEAHWFGKLTGYKFNDSHPHISSRQWNPSLAGRTPETAWAQFDEAAKLDRQAAIQATSWGAFQIMGFHWNSIGYESPEALERAADTAGGQLDMFVRFIMANPNLLDAMRRQDWWQFTAGYNGTGQIEVYSKRIATAFAKHSDGAIGLRVGDSGPDVAELQRALGVAADGIFGARTDKAVRAFQAAHGLTVDGIVGAQTLSALQGD